MKQKQKKGDLEWPFFSFTPEPTLKPGESVSSLLVDLTVGKHNGDHRTFDECRHVKFWIFNTPESGTHTLLAAILLHAWQSAVETKSLGRSIAELSKIAEENGWIDASDVNAHLAVVKRGGRPPGTVSKDTRKFSKMFEEMRPKFSDDASVIKTIARKTLPKRTSLHKIHLQEAKIKRALHRVNLIRKPTLKSNGK